jgi:hypothetical protein
MLHQKRNLYSYSDTLQPWATYNTGLEEIHENAKVVARLPNGDVNFFQIHKTMTEKDASQVRKRFVMFS